MKKFSFLLAFTILLINAAYTQSANREKFNSDWKFLLNDDNAAAATEAFNDAAWRKLNLPHDWSIELAFDSTSPSGTGGGALRGGIGWYRKTFRLPIADQSKNIFIDFDGVYRNSEVFINGHSLGKRPNGYISFRYDLTPYLHFGKEENTIAVRVDNSDQPNSRWYSGSGIYRNVWLVKAGKKYVSQWGTYITTPEVSNDKATINIKTSVTGAAGACDIVTSIFSKEGKLISTATSKINSPAAAIEAAQQFIISKPVLWSIENPYLYKAVTKVISNGKVSDEFNSSFGIRTFSFDADKGFFLNGKHVKIFGTCLHHDLGCLGTALNVRALERQLQLMKGMGVNGIRTTHNPPAPELLELCDKMGFIVMDEAFDMWRRKKSTHDYSEYFDAWYKKDLTDQVMRDRNHPSVFIWSVGNEIPEQWSKEEDFPATKALLTDLCAIVKNLDNRPTLTANDQVKEWNSLLRSNIADIVGYNYNHTKWLADSVQQLWGKKAFIVTESASALQTRGHYDMPSDSIRRWPIRWDIPFTTGNADITCSAYENCSAPWGSTNAEAIQSLLKNDNVSGMYIWTGMDYLGEPTPYGWPARSSYFGVVDLAGFPKDSYYLYQSIFTSKPMLHLFPHWNWQPGQTIDMWAYYNNADEVELFINGKSQGVKKKTGDDLYVMWRVQYEPGIVKAVSKRNGRIVLTEEIKTAGAPAKIILSADRNSINANGEDLSFVSVKIVDKDGNLIPDANNLIQFDIKGAGFIAGVDNGCQTDLSSFKANSKKAFNGMALAVIQSTKKAGVISLIAKAEGLPQASITVSSK